MNTKLFTTLKKLIVLFVILTMLPSMLAFADSGPRPEPAAPVDQMPASEAGVAAEALMGSLALTSGDVFQAGADRLAALQRSDGGWGWPLDYPAGTPSAPNIVGPIAQGLAEAY